MYTNLGPSGFCGLHVLSLTRLTSKLGSIACVSFHQTYCGEQCSPKPYNNVLELFIEPLLLVYALNTKPCNFVQVEIENVPHVGKYQKQHCNEP